VRSTPLPSSTVLLAAALAAGALAVPRDAGGAVVLTKTRAREAAVQVARETCSLTSWCRRIAVEPARACERNSTRRVQCEMRFRDPDGDWAAGLVEVTRKRGRLQVGAAVPTQPGTSTGTPSVL
jgi:hypothetical protein